MPLRLLAAQTRQLCAPNCGLVSSTVNQELRILRRLLRLAVECGMIEKAPKLQMLRGENPRERVVGEGEVAVYLSYGTPLLAG